MAAYFIVDVNVDDPVTYEEYRKQVAPIVDHYGGRFLARGGATESIEGDWQSERLVIIEFADSAAFHRWYDSPEYRAILTIRFSASRSRAILVNSV